MTKLSVLVAAAVAGPALFVFKGVKTNVAGSYRARVVFPRAGRYSRAHTFKSVVIAAV